MKQVAALLWKEYREARRFFFAGLAIFVGFPLIILWIEYDPPRWYSWDIPLIMVGFFGGLFAMLVGVGATSRDSSPELESFWQSRPIGILRWLITKYVVNLLVILVVTILALLLQMVIEPRLHPHSSNTFLTAFLYCHSFTLVLIYSIAFLVGCLVRQAVHAAILSSAAGLAIYFLPLVFPPLQHFNLFLIVEQMWNAAWEGRSALGKGYGVFTAGMLTGSVASVLLAWFAVRRNLQIEMGQRLLAWVLGGVGLVLFASGSFQLGTNLKCEKVIPVEPKIDQLVTSIAISGEQGVIAHYGSPSTPGQPSENKCLWLRTFDLSRPDGGLGRETKVMEGGPLSRLMGPHTIVYREAPHARAYFFWDQHTGKRGDWKNMRQTEVCLDTVSLEPPSTGTVTHQLDLKRVFPEPTRMKRGTVDYCYPRMCLYQGRIYLADRDRIAIFSLEDPDVPTLEQVIENVDLARSFEAEQDSSRPIRRFRLLPLPRLSPRERLQVAVELELLPVLAAMEGDVMVVHQEDGYLVTYRLIGFEGEDARFETIGRRFGTPLERFATHHGQEIFVRDGLAYVREGRLLRGLTVYDVRDPSRPRRAGHYSRPNEDFQRIVPLPGGRVLLAGRNLHIVAPPGR